MNDTMRKKLLLAIAFAMGIWAYVLLLAATPKAGADAPAPIVKAIDLDEGITPFFSPSGGCTDAIVAEIGKAKKSLDIQAFSFTSPSIAQAVADAQSRGVSVRVVLDKSQRTDHYSAATFLLNHGIPVYIDEEHAIAHNKIILIDGKTLITGSFNFTTASEERNAENLLIIRNRPKLMIAYKGNFERHLSHSNPLTPAPVVHHD
ncbi:MAG TPA: phospholipase D family protein [Tepidisphaeraceae bacterium]|jgi:phosphatidylserine/phosphatidylglycerophosphate/cardiolipin synthase-like enzyme|nr:phospholipase D family protein [Tepidisphaeraceae bacterium]